MKSNCLYDSEQKFKPILCKSQTKILSFSSVQKKKKKKKKPTDRPNPKTMGRVTANKLFIKDGLKQCHVLAGQFENFSTKQHIIVIDVHVGKNSPTFLPLYFNIVFVFL